MVEMLSPPPSRPLLSGDLPVHQLVDVHRVVHRLNSIRPPINHLHPHWRVRKKHTHTYEANNVGIVTCDLIENFHFKIDGDETFE
jgi:hypothetical protein